MVLKVGMITPWKVRCGIATYSEALAKELAENDVEVYIVRLPRFGAKTAEILQDVVERIPKEAEIIHVQHEYGLYQQLDSVFFTALARLGKPIITTMHGIGNWSADALIGELSQKIIVHNEHCAEKFGGNKEKIEIIHHGAQLVSGVSRSEAKKKWNIDPLMPIVGYVGFLTEYKGLETLVEAMLEVKKAGLLICGGYHLEYQTTYITRLMDGAKRILGKRVQFTGYVPDEKMATAYGAIDVLVYPSRWATESGALITALSYGKAVIASGLKPFKEKEEEGALITFNDTKDLAAKIKMLLADEKQTRKLEEGAKEWAYRNSWHEIAKQHVRLYHKLHHSISTEETL